MTTSLAESSLVAEHRARYAEDGFVVVRNLLPKVELLRLLAGLDRLICAKLPGALLSREDRLQDEIHAKLARLAQCDRPALGRVYDAARKLLPFWGLVHRVGQVYQDLTGALEPGVAHRGCGIRLDLPGEHRWRSEWHQEYHSQMSSLDGATAWFGLVPVNSDMGPVEFLRGSKAAGLLSVHCPDPRNVDRDYTRTFVLEAPDALAANYPTVQVETGLGDVVFLNFLTVHRSGWNRSPDRSRISCQVRLFDMADPRAAAQNWLGGWQDGADFTQLHPDKVLP